MQSLIIPEKFNIYKKFLETVHNPPYTVLDYTVKDKISFVCDNNHTNTVVIGTLCNRKSKYLKSKISRVCLVCISNKKKEESITSSALSVGKLEYVLHPASNNFDRSEKYYEMERKFGLTILGYTPATEQVSYICGNCKTNALCRESGFFKKITNSCIKCRGSVYKLTFEDLCKSFSSAGLSVEWTKEQFNTEYENSHTLVKYTCSCGESAYMSASNCKHGSKCASCKTERSSATNMLKYGVPRPSQNEDVKEKICSTNIRRYGVPHILQNPKIRARINETVQNVYGVSNLFQNEDVKQQIKETNILKYGVPNPMQNKTVFNKQQKSSFSLKDYTMQSGEIKRVQGFEPQCLKELDNGRHGPILAGNNDDLPIIDYTFDNKEHKYNPDIYLPEYNLIIEVKSIYTLNADLDKNKAKAAATESAGYNYAFWVLVDKDSRLPIIYRLYLGELVEGRMIVEDQVEGVDYCNVY